MSIEAMRLALEALESVEPWEVVDHDPFAVAITALRAALAVAAEREKIVSQWDVLHEKYMADPLRRHMMLSYEMVANLIKGRT